MTLILNSFIGLLALTFVVFFTWSVISGNFKKVVIEYIRNLKFAVFTLGMFLLVSSVVTILLLELVQA